MVIERYVILTITLLLSAVLFLAPITTTSAATINNYFNYKDENDNEKDIYRDKYKKEKSISKK